MKTSLLPTLAVIAALTIAVFPESAHAVETWVGTNGKAATSQLGQADFSGDVRNRNAGPPANERFFTPSDVVIDPATGKVFVSDTNNHRVLRFSSMEALNNGGAAEFVFGQLSFDKNTAAAGRAGLNEPTGLALDSAGVLWVADSGNNRVVSFLSAVTATTLPAGFTDLIGQSDENETTPGSEKEDLSNPTGLETDDQDNLWVADSANHRVLFFLSPRGGDATPDKVLGNATYNGVSGGSTLGTMNLPSDVAIAGDVLWVADTANNRVLRFDAVSTKANGDPADALLGQTAALQTDPGTSITEFHRPQGIHVDVRGRLFVADTRNNRIVHFRAAASKGSGASADGILGKSSFTDDVTQPAAANTMNGPIAVGTSGVSQLWVCDGTNHRVLRFDSRNNSAVLSSLRRQLRVKQRQLRRLRILQRRLTGQLRANPSARAVIQRNIRRSRIQVRKASVQIRRTSARIRILSAV